MSTLGYCRQLSEGESLDDDLERLTGHGAERVFTDTFSARKSLQPGLTSCLAELRPGDTLLVSSSARLSHTISHLVDTLAGFAEAGVRFVALDEPDLAITDPSRATLALALRKARHSIHGTRTRQGMVSASVQGRSLGRPSVMTVDKTDIARELRRAGRSYSHIARTLDVSPSAVRRALGPA